MIFSISLLLALAPTALFAAPTRTVASRDLADDVISLLQDGACDLSAALMPNAPTPLPPPSAGLYLSHVAIGRGTQNYTCTSRTADVKPKAVGAVAKLYNVTCGAVRAPSVTAHGTAVALKYAVPVNDVSKYALSGHHEFTDKGVPLFVLSSETANFGYVQAKLNASSPAPVRDQPIDGDLGRGDIPWLKLNATEGDYSEVFRLNTAGGVAPPNCADTEGDFSIDYSAEYWFWKEA